MNKPFRLLLRISILAMIVSSCGSKNAVVKKFYLLDMERIESTTLSDSLTTVPLFCEILPVIVYPAYSTRQIVIRSQSHEIRYYTYHEWAVRPQEILTKIMEQYLRKQNVFKEASVRFWKNVPEVKIEATVYGLEIVEEKGGFLAHLNMHIELRHADSDQVLVSYNADSYQELEEKDLNLFASAISKMYTNELRQFSIKCMSLSETEFSLQ